MSCFDVKKESLKVNLSPVRVSGKGLFNISTCAHVLRYLFFRRGKKQFQFRNQIVLVLVSSLFSVYSAFGFMSGADRYELSIGGGVPFYAPGMHLRYNWNTQYYTKLGAGFALEFLMNTHQKVLNELGVSTDTSLLTKALVNSVVFDLRFGWSMSVYEGPYIELGYGLMLLGKGEVKGSEINKTTNLTNQLSNNSTNQVNIINHGPALYLGYRFILMDKLTLNMDLGAYKPLFSSTKLDYGNIAVPAGESGKVNDLVVRELWFLSLGIWLGLSF